MNKLRTAHTALTLLALCATQAQAQGANEPRTWLRAHATAGDWRTSVNGSGPYGQADGSLVSTDEIWRTPPRATLSGVGFGRLIGERWRIEIDRESARRNGSTVLASDLQRGSTTYLAGTRLDTQVGLAVLRLHGGWAAFKADSVQLGVLFGGQRVEITQRLDGTATQTLFTSASPTPVTGPPGPVSQSDSDSSFAALGGLFGDWRPAPDWRLYAMAERGHGGFAQARVHAQWWPLRHLALEGGYRFMRADIDNTTCFMGCARFLVSYRVRGPELAATLAF